jgi:hypothetical protein
VSSGLNASGTKCTVVTEFLGVLAGALCATSTESEVMSREQI